MFVIQIHVVEEYVVGGKRIDEGIRWNQFLAVEADLGEVRVLKKNHDIGDFSRDAVLCDTLYVQMGNSSVRHPLIDKLSGTI